MSEVPLYSASEAGRLSAVCPGTILASTMSPAASPARHQSNRHGVAASSPDIDFVDFDLMSRIGGVSPHHPQARIVFFAEIIPSVSETEAGLAKVGRNTVTSGGPVTVAVTEPIPCYSSSEGLFSVCLASGNQRRSCHRSRERASVTVSKQNYSQPCNELVGRATCTCISGQKKRGRLRSQKNPKVH